MGQEQHCYSIRVSVKDTASQQQIIEDAKSLLASALGAMPSGIDYKGHQLVLKEETVEDVEDYLIWEGALLVDVVVSCLEDDYQDWYWDRDRREGTLNQALTDGADQIRWIDLRAV
jgi:hypothetical protein